MIRGALPTGPEAGHAGRRRRTARPERRCPQLRARARRPGSPWTPWPGARASTPIWSGGSSPSAWSTPTRDAAGGWCSPRRAPAALARIQRLRAGLCLNYASLGLVLDLLDRISQLEAALRRSNAGTRSDRPPWT